MTNEIHILLRNPSWHQHIPMTQVDTKTAPPRLRMPQAELTELHGMHLKRIRIHMLPGGFYGSRNIHINARTLGSPLEHCVEAMISVMTSPVSGFNAVAHHGIEKDWSRIYKPPVLL